MLVGHGEIRDSRASGRVKKSQEEEDRDAHNLLQQ